MIKNANAFNFQEVCDQFLRRIDTNAWEAAYKAMDEVSKEAVQKLKSSSAATFGAGPYSKNWKRTLEKGRVTGYATVHGGKPTYRLAHLLEKGHAKRNGGRVPGKTHIKPVEEWAIDEAINRTIEYIEDMTI